MWKRFSQSKTLLAIASGIMIFLAFPRWEILPSIFFFPIFLTLLTFRCTHPLTGFLYGFLTSFVVMLGGFYWVTHVIHEFGHLSWAISIVLFVGFCGVGALNFPLFMAFATFINRQLEIEKRSENSLIIWTTLGLPALFTCLEFAIPKLFPWYVCHCLYSVPWLLQIAEFTGCTYLSFSIYSLGGALAFFLLKNSEGFQAKPLLAPLLLWTPCFIFGFFLMNESTLKTKSFRVALIQANIESMEKLAAGHGLAGKIRFTIDKYIKLTSLALKKPTDLVVWPETALPFFVRESDPWGREILDTVRRWGVPLITGAYAPGIKSSDDFNSAYLLEPRKDGSVLISNYHKNVLLAFGEYMPFGEVFPFLYRVFPDVSRFERGAQQNPLTMKNGLRLGTTICYEAIIPGFVRRVASHKVHALINLTNDSWFGLTSEPYHHGALSIFRAIETRLPLIRVTNTGISFTVDTRGRMSQTTGVYTDGVLHSVVHLPTEPPQTFYVRYGDWFIGVSTAILGLCLVILYKERHAPVPL